MRKYTVPQNATLTYLLSDHLGSTSLTMDSVTNEVIETRYKAWGEVRYTTPSKTLPTRNTFTGQYSYVSDDATDLGSSGFGLMFYNARWYDPSLGRFAQADTIVPGGSQGLDRYAYGLNNPSRYTDPTGHCVEAGDAPPDSATNQHQSICPTPYSKIIAQNEKYQDDCASGTNEACPGGIKGLIAFGVKAIITAGVSETVILDGAGADAVAAAPRVGLQALAHCLVNSVCRYALAKLGLEGWAIRQLAQASYQNPGSNELVIGLYPDAGQTYINLAKSRGASYFNMPSYVWDIVAKNDVTWEINEEVLQMSKSANQTVILQTEFSKGMTLTTTNFYKELWFFIYNNYSVIDQNTLTPTNNGGFGFP